MPEDVLKETAATSDPPRGVASPEFFFLLQRVDRVDEKLSTRIDQLDEKLTGEINSVRGEIKAVETKLGNQIDHLDGKMNKLWFWSVGTVVTIVVGFAGTIVALVVR